MHDNNDAFWLERTERARTMLPSATTVCVRPARSHTAGLDLWDQWLRDEIRRHAEGSAG